MINWSQVDPLLATTAQVMNPLAVAELFARRGFSSGRDAALPAAIQSCRLQELHYQPASQCTAVYHLLVGQTSQLPLPTIGVVKAGSTSCSTRLYQEDSDLPWLAEAADATAMSVRFQAIYPDITALQVVPVRYKPNTRCVLRYAICSQAGQHSCFGKSLAQNARQLAAVLIELARRGRTAPELPRVPAVLAYWPDLRMVVQAAVAGQELHTALFDPTAAVDRRLAWFAQAGQATAALHNLTAIPAPSRTYRDDLAELRAYLPAIARLAEPLARRYAAMLARLRAWAQRRDEPAPVPSHGALRTDQFLFEGEQLVMIDLDSFCWANPARDVGNWLAYLGWKALRQPQHATVIAQAEPAFLAAYQAQRPGLDVDWLAFYRVLSMLKIVGRRFQGLTWQEWPLLPQLFDAMHSLLSPLTLPPSASTGIGEEC